MIEIPTESSLANAPFCALTLVRLYLGGKTVWEDSRVWVHEEFNGQSLVEFEGQQGFVPDSALVKLPVPAPPLEVMQEREPCFGLPQSEFDLEYHDQGKMFEIRRCKAHGTRFLNDTRGGFAMYSLLILLEESEKDTEPELIWRKYHQRSDSWLHYHRLARFF